MFLIIDETLRREHPSWIAEFDEVIDFEGDATWCGRAAGELDLTVEGDRVRVTGPVTALVPRECGLCLGHYLEAVDAELGEVAMIEEVGPSEEAEFDEDVEVWRVGLGGRLSLTELVRQAVLLALPTRAVCGEACTGRDTLAELESARSERVDPRLSVLSELLEGEDDEDGSPQEESQ